MTTDTALTPAQAQMVADNLGLAGWAVNKWARFLPADPTSAGYTQEDARQDAIFGLATAAQKYDPSLGYTFATYASANMRQAIQRGIGTYHGVDYRRDAAHQGTAEVNYWLSLDVKVDGHASSDSAEYGDLFPDEHDHEGEMDAAATRAILDNHRATLCTTSVDHQLLDAMCDPDTDWTMDSLVVKPIATTHAMSPWGVQKRLTAMRHSIAGILGYPPPQVQRRPVRSTTDVRTDLVPYLEANPVITAGYGTATVAAIAEAIGASRDQTNRALKALDDDGLIARQINGRVTERIEWLGTKAAA